MNFRRAANHLPSTLAGRDQIGLDNAMLSDDDARNSDASENDNDPPVEELPEEAIEGMLHLCNVDNNCNELSQEDFEGVVQHKPAGQDHKN